MNSKPRDDFERRLDEDDGSYPESWKPRPGDTIVGKIVKYDQVEGKFGPSVVVVLECLNDGGQPYRAGVWLSHAVLVDRFKKLRPKVGERVGIKRLPDRQGANGRYASYVVHVDRPAAETTPDWEAMDGLDRGVEIGDDDGAPARGEFSDGGKPPF